MLAYSSKNVLDRQLLYHKSQHPYKKFSPYLSFQPLSVLNILQHPHFNLLTKCLNPLPDGKGG